MAPLLPSLKDFTAKRIISKGGFGTIKLATKNSDGTLYAIKSISKSYIQTKNIVQQVFNERDALALVNCEFVVRIFYSFQTAKCVHLVMEYMAGGDLKSLLHKLGRFTNFMTRFYISELTMALNYLHKKNIIHKDLKPDNVLIANSGHIKLSDFGLSKLNLDHQLNINDLINTTPMRKISTTMADNTPLNMMYSQRIKRAYSRTPGQLLSLTTQFTFSPTLENKPQKNKHTNDPSSKDIQFHFSSTSQHDLAPSQLPVPFLESSKHENSIHTCYNKIFLDPSDSFENSSHLRDDSTFNDNTKLLDIVSNSHLIHHNLSDTLLKSSHFIEDVDECNSLSSKKPRLNSAEIITPINLANPENFNAIVEDRKQSGDSVWGTPDYLAPEILLRSREGSEVDWWALGVCFYEFLCGFPPFNDDSVELIFKNIIDRDLVWPPISDSVDFETEKETITLLKAKFGGGTCPTVANGEIPTISSNAADIISKLLHPEPQSRANFNYIVKHPYFSGTNWNNIINSIVPFAPEKFDFRFLS